MSSLLFRMKKVVKSIQDIIKGKVSTHVFPVGRLDRDTTGLLLITNDGDLTKRLSHPSYEVKKIYHATLNKPLEEEHFEQIKKGIQLEDAPDQSRWNLICQGCSA